MNRPEPIELENNLGPDAVTGEINRVPWMAYDVDEMDIYIAELEQKLAEKDKEIESLKASHYAESVDAGMRERRLRRALWMARGCIMTLLQRDFQRLAYQCNNDDYKKNLLRRRNRFYDLHEKCIKKAEEYK